MSVITFNDFVSFATRQVSQLILVNEAYENGEKEGFPDDLGANAEHVRKSADGLVMAASRLASESQDDVSALISTLISYE